MSDVNAWQPIETAPLDESGSNGPRNYVLMWSALDGMFVGYAWAIKDRRFYSDYPGCIEGNDVYPTHWMPLPAPPQSNDAQGEQS